MGRNGALQVIMRSIMVIALTFVWVVGGVPAYGKNATGSNNNSNNLPTELSNSQQNYLKEFGLLPTNPNGSIEQPSRQNAKGQTINKNTDTPFGRHMIVLDRTFQLAFAGISKSNPYNVYQFSKAHDNLRYFQRDPLIKNSTAPGLYDEPKAMVGADINGIGKDDLVIVALTPNPNPKLKFYDLKITVTSYTKAGVSRTGSTVLTSTINKPWRLFNPAHFYLDHQIHVVAGDFDHNVSDKDEIAITVGNNLYVAAVSTTTEGSSSLKVKATLLWHAVYDADNPHATVSNTQQDPAEMDLAAADTNGDGYKDLLVTTGSRDGGMDGHVPRLLIYSDTPSAPHLKAPNPVADIPLESLASQVFVAPNVAVGDIYGNGKNDIVITGEIETDGKIPPNIDFLGTQRSVGLSDITYDPTTGKYSQLAPVQYLNMQPLKGSVYNIHMAPREMDGLAIVPESVLGVDEPALIACGDHVFEWDTQKSEFVVKSYGPHESGSYHLTMQDIVGADFIGGNNGREQIAMLYTLTNISSSGYYLTLLSPEPSGIIRTSSTMFVFEPYLPAIAAPDMLNNGIKYTYEAKKTEFTYTDPTVLAVLAPAPYYAGLQYPPGLGNSGTGFGTGSGSENTKSKGLEVSASATAGFGADINVLGLKISDFSATVSMEDSLTEDWSSSTSAETTISYNNYVDSPNDSAFSVVVSIVPEDVYYYKQTGGSSSTQTTLTFPYDPITTIMPVPKYNSIIEKYNIANAPYIDIGDVLGGIQAGNPSSYPSTTSGLSNATGEPKVSDFVSSGSGDNTIDRTINLTSSNSTSVSNTVKASLDVEGKFAASSLIFGFSAAGGYTNGSENTVSTSTTTEGIVAGVPEGVSQFEWALDAYNYNLEVGNSNSSSSSSSSAQQTILVVSYLVRGAGLGQPQDVTGKSESPSSATLHWNPVNDNTAQIGYHVLCSTSEEGSYTTVGTISPGDTSGAIKNGRVTWTDSSLKPNQTYYYKVEAFENNASKEVDGLPSSAVQVRTPGALTLKVDFQVGTQDLGWGLVPSHLVPEEVVPKKGLVPDQPLTATASITNNGQAQQAIFIVALYDADGAMVKESNTAVDIGADGVGSATTGFTLPDNVTGDTVAAFLWKGTNLSSSPPVPLSNVVKMPS